MAQRIAGAGPIKPGDRVRHTGAAVPDNAETGGRSLSTKAKLADVLVSNPYREHDQ